MRFSMIEKWIFQCSILYIVAKKAFFSFHGRIFLVFDLEQLRFRCFLLRFNEKKNIYSNLRMNWKFQNEISYCRCGFQHKKFHVSHKITKTWRLNSRSYMKESWFQKVGHKSHELSSKLTFKNQNTSKNA